ncbi:hypothetical protein COCSUDRAFT_41846 [Coccomyxa subellipsoidea C-169]|uniref:Uncharacterized protein n=1 Tax=Coccomyxa subellipsoidea (strain C-169) TaxID=574566 RepID=I0YZ54_COCSC|nr:hypothetical protein COCSUDRAFT_41846 [Coccomyxa subellipsoidea C-169]EIE23673.1 hypothetical protein COCSUDRAFT_41846 [Coccomyxa subellipsoidea C-169]|eukprot:XP_005648217.1 hypothetical protein COCSUDRAFT_41846 [Coccomyxa subellipsoidea C-169]
MKFLAIFVLMLRLAWAQGLPTSTTDAEEPWAAAMGDGYPVLTSFDGHTFQFPGRAGQYYDLISADEHQVTMKLQAGQAWNHTGTFIEGLGVQYHQHKIIVSVNAHDVLAVFMNGQELRMREEQTKQERMLAVEDGSELLLAWSLQYPELGNAVEIVTDLLRIVTWVTPAQTVDQDGVYQPAYLNFDAQLLAPPHGEMQGVVGEGFARLISGRREEDHSQLHGMVADYQMASYFEGRRPLAYAGGSGAGGGWPLALPGGGGQRRLLREDLAGRPKFPLHARGRSAKLSQVRARTKAARMRRLSDKDVKGVLTRSQKAMHHMGARRAGVA